jgi:hypothetical protein
MSAICDELSSAKVLLARDYVSPKSCFIVSCIREDNVTLAAFYITHPLWLTALHDSMVAGCFALEHQPR